MSRVTQQRSDSRPKSVISYQIKQAVIPEKEGTFTAEDISILCNEKSKVITTACP